MFKYLTALMSLVNLAQQEVVTTAQGKIRGVVQQGFTSFMGIPYASVNEVDGRYKQAGLAPSWSGIRESQQSRCSETSRIEECLQLEVHVPDSGASPPWPVLVWIRGGSGRYDPGQVVRREVVAVIVSHRLGTTGFLCLGEERIPGNAGVKDVIVALRWVRDNISAFKGNPHTVVIAGQSFGAAMVEALVLSPMSQGLFHGAIIQSGSILSPWAFNYDAKERATVLEITDSGEHIDIMSANLDTLAHSSNKIEYPYFPFAMCAENPFRRQEMLLSDPPHRLLSDSALRKVPLIIGYNSYEGYVFVSNLKKNNIPTKVRRDLSVLLPEELKFSEDIEIKGVVEQILNFYFRNNNYTMATLILYHSDAYFASHVYRSLRLHAASDLPIYFYQFSHSAELGVSSVHGEKKQGAAHSDELAYLFPEKTNRFDSDNSIVQSNLILLWTNFVKHLDPNGMDRSISWERFELQNPRLMDISSELMMRNIPRLDAMQMWDDIYNRFFYSRNTFTK